MKPFISFIFSTQLPTLFVLMLAGCSDVSFSPGQPPSAQSLTNPVLTEEPSQNVPENPPINPPIQPPTNPPPQYVKVRDTFYQENKEAKVDILVVIDNSPSMLEEQAKIGEKITSFLGHLSDVDWQLGITTTDISGGTYSSNGELLKLEGAPYQILTKTTPRFNQVFLKTITRPESDCYQNCASVNEQPLKAAIMAMDKRDRQNQGFFRNHSDFVLVIISDEDEMSTGPLNATSPQNVVDHFQSIWGSTKNFTSYAIVIRPGDLKCYESNFAGGGNYGDFASELAIKTGGIVGSICDADYGSSLSKIGQQVRTLLSAFPLSEDPLDDLIQITLTPYQDIPWHLEGRKIIFKKAPLVGTRIDVDYSISFP